MQVYSLMIISPTHTSSYWQPALFTIQPWTEPPGHFLETFHQHETRSNPAQLTNIQPIQQPRPTLSSKRSRILGLQLMIFHPICDVWKADTTNGTYWFWPSSHNHGSGNVSYFPFIYKGSFPLNHDYGRKSKHPPSTPYQVTPERMDSI